MSAINSYRALLHTVGPAYILVAFLGRIPLAMSQLGTLMVVSNATGSYGIGGAAAGALALVNAFGAPFAGSLSDRIGQRPVVAIQSIAGALGLVSIVWISSLHVHPGVIVLVAAFAGVAIPQIGPLARVRWSPIVSDREDSHRLIDAAFSYEGAADEASFVLGPTLVGFLVAIVNPSGALIAAAVILGLFGTWFALHPTAQMRNDVTAPGTDSLISLALFVLALAQFSIGMVFGSSQTGSLVVAIENNRPAMAGLMHAMLGVGSVVAGLTVAALPESISYAKRAQVSAVGLFTLSVPLLFADTITHVVVVIFFLGFAVAPFMISNFALAGHIVQSDRVGMAMTLLAGATGIGYAAGATLAGRLADFSGHTASFAVTVMAGLLAVIVSRFSKA